MSSEPPTKRQRYMSNITEVAGEAKMPRGTKRKARSPSESPKEKRRKCSNDVEICKPSASMVRDKEAECERDLSAEQVSGSSTLMMSYCSDSSFLSSSSSSNSKEGMFYTAETSEGRLTM